MKNLAISKQNWTNYKIRSLLIFTFNKTIIITILKFNYCLLKNFLLLLKADSPQETLYLLRD